MKLKNKSKKLKFYDSTNIDNTGAPYRMIYGERSNGKTYCIKTKGLKNYIKTGEQFAYIRRWQEDFRGKRGESLFSDLISNDANVNYIEEWSKGKYNSVYYYSMRWYLCKELPDGKRVMAPEPFCIGFALSNMEHDKGNSYPNITMIFFDEFISRDLYHTDEFVIFTNTISTIVRHRDNVVIYMCGNTINKFNPYFAEMGLKHASQMKPGDIDIYTYGDSRLKVAVEYADGISREGKPSDFYFAFDNPKLQMITGGSWEIGIYPHCPYKYLNKEIIFKFFLKFDIYKLEGDVILHGNDMFIYFHEKSTDFRYPDTDLIYSTDFDPRPNWRRNLLKPQFPIESRICELFRNEKIFYQNNEIGDAVWNYLNWCKTA